MKCQKCKKEIIFGITKNGKAIPIDLDSLSEEDMKWLLSRNPNDNTLLPFRWGEHVTHFATCTNPEQFRKE